MSVFVVAQSSSEIPEGLMNNPVFSANMNSSVYDDFQGHVLEIQCEFGLIL